MSNNTIMVNMKFQADTSQAKKKMQELQNSLKSLQSLNSVDLPMGKTVAGLEQAKNAAAQLQVQLQAAFNQNTGKLDLTRFNQSLKQSNISLQQYKNILMQAGPVGQQAFGQLAVQIASADTHVIRISQRLSKLGTTLANTFRWQISSAALMSITSTISEAYRFAQDLNKSLNDIRIVSGNSADEMERFARQANNAAKALSTTTNEYAKASLIYFQQGLSEKEVKERTELTIKMANVTGQSVSEVSDQLTAVWNNFDNGTKTLEYYVDVMTALGAATASSSQEISEGLNKFAAVAETVGLSYEYAAAALATVTATTRQSADVVGTAFKTLFARIQDLELGNTLEDGTTLGQYSQALASVGINIKDVNGEVKDMNSILDEMGAKWNTLSKDSQIALAQNVAGVRQYTQLIALMDNWSYFQENLNTAYTSTGELQKQADIYAEGWEAARDRVTAALEDIYQDLLDDDVFIGILNFFADFLENVDNVIESVGGLNGVLTILAAVLLKVYQNSIAISMSSLGATMMSWTKNGQEKLNNLRAEGYKEATTMHDETNASGRLSNQSIRNKIDVESRYNELTANATEQQKAILSIRKEALQKQNEENEKLIEELQTLEQITAELKKQQPEIQPKKALYTNSAGRPETATWAGFESVAKQAGAAQVFQTDFNYDAYDDRMGAYLSGDYSDKSLNRAQDATQEMIAKMEGLSFGADNAEKELKEMFGEEVYNALNKYYEKLKETQQTIQSLQKSPELRKQAATEDQTNEKNQARIEQLKNKKKLTKSEGKELSALKKEAQQYEKTHGQLQKSANKVEDAIQNTNKQLKAQQDALIKATDGSEEAKKKVQEFATVNQGLGEKAAKAGVQIGKASGQVNQLNDTLIKSLGPVTFSQKLTTFASMTMSASMALQGFKSLIDVWNNEDTSFGDKLIQSMMSLSMIIPAVTTLMNKQNLARLFGVNAMKLENGEWAFNTTQKGANTVATWLQKIAQDALNGSIAATIAMLAIFAAAVIAVVGIIYLFTRAQEKEKTALEKATETYKQNKQELEALNEELNKAKTNLEEVKTLLDSYQEVSNTFDSLVEGSSAWNENLYKHNEIIGELLKKYPELIEMGAIGYDTSGFYTVLNEGLLQQYTQGQASVEMLEAQIAQTVGTINTNRSALELNFATRNQKLDTKAADKLIQSDYLDIANQTNKGTWLINNKEYNQSAEYLSQAYGTMRDVLVNGEDFEVVSNTMVTLYNDLGADMIEAAKEFVADYRALSTDEIKERESSLEKLKKQNEALYISLAQSMLSYQKGFSDLDGQQTQAATTILAKKIEGFFDGLPTYEIAQGRAVSSDFANRLAGYVDYQGVTGWNESKDMAYNLENSSLGQKVVDKYFQETYGQPLETFGSDVEWSAREIKFKLEDGSEEIVSLSSIISNALTEAAYELSNMEDIIAKVATYSKEKLAAINLSFSGMAETEMQKIGTQIKPGDKTSGYKLDDKYINEAIQTYFNDSSLLYVGGSVMRNGESKAVSPEEATEIKTYINDLTLAAQNYNAALIETTKLNEDRKKGNAYIAEQAELYDLETETLQRYAKSLQEANDISYEAAAKMAIANAKMSKGISQLEKALDDYLQVLKDNDAQSYEFAEGAAEVGEALKFIFGVDISNNLISEWAKSGDLEKLIAGGEEAVETFQRLELAAGKDYIMSLSLDETYKAQFTSMLEELTSQEYDGITVGIKGEIDQSYINSINELLATGKITADEVNAMFNSIGWDPNISFETVQGPPQVAEQKVFDYDENTGSFSSKPISWQRIETSAQMQVPKIGDVTSAPKSTSSIKTNVSSGGSGSSKKKSSRYHEISEELQDLERQYNKISKAREKAFGANRLALLDQEIGKTKDLISAQDEYISQIQTNLMKDASALDRWINPGDVDASGRIKQEAIDKNWNKEGFQEALAQYEETLNLLEAERDKYQELLDQELELKIEQIEYRVDLKVSLAEDSLKTLEYQIEKLGDSFDKVAEAITKYAEQFNNYDEEYEAKTQGLKDRLTEKGFSDESIEKIFNGGSLEKEDFQDKNGETITLDDKDIQAIRDYKDYLIDWEKTAQQSFENVSKSIIAAADDYNEKLDKNADSIKRYGKVAGDVRNIVDLLGGTLKGSDEIIGNLTRQSVASAKGAAEAAKISVVDSRANLEAAQAEKQAYINNQLKINPEFEGDAVTEEWDKTIEALTEDVETAEDNWTSTISESLQAVADAFGTSMDQIFKEFEKMAAGKAGTFENLQAQFDREKEKSSWYLQEYEKVYQLSKLNRDITNSIDETDNVKAKQRLAELQEEMNELQADGRKVSQYELDNLQAKYDLRLAEIALEEAQNAKSQVRMSRDSEGNWSYVYTADQDKVDEAQQNYEDKLYNIQNLQQEYIQSSQDHLVSLEAERAEALRQIMNDTTLSAEEKKKKMDEINTYYNEQAGYWNEQLGIALGDAKELYDQDMTNYSNATGYKLLGNKQWVDDFGETTLSEITGYQTLEEHRNAFVNNSNTLLDNLGKAADEYEKNITDVMNKAGVSINSLSGPVGEAGNGLKDFGQLIEDMADDAETAIGDKDSGLIGSMYDLGENDPFATIVSNASKAYDEYNNTIKNYIDKNDKLIGSLDKVIAKYADLTTAKGNVPEDTNPTGGGAGFTSPPPKGPPDDTVSGEKTYSFTAYEFKNLTGDTEEVKNISEKDIVSRQDVGGGVTYVIWTDANNNVYEGFTDQLNGYSNPYQGYKARPVTPKENLYFDKYSSSTREVAGIPYVLLSDGKTWAKKDDVYNTDYWDDSQNNSSGSQIKLDKNSKIFYTIDKFDTGGYTGSWNSSGRLAILHQKELVLNAADTENFLAAVNIVRELSNAIDLRTLAYQSMFSQAASAASINEINRALQQEVTIKAEFPNARDRNEIEEAFKSLVNHASQFANRKN